MGTAGLSGVLLLVGCGGKFTQHDSAGQGTTPFEWDLPAHVTPPKVPTDNPITVEKVTLGRVLFHDFQLSIDGGRSCGICHEQQKGFTDGFVKAVGTFGDRHTRNTPTILNVAWRAPLNWRDPELFSLEDQLLGPLMGTDPVEMGMADNEPLLLERLADFDPYPALFSSAFPGDDEPITLTHMVHAITSYERTLTSFDSPYDRYLAGDAGAMGEAAERGMALFESERLGCTACHSGLLLDRPLNDDGEAEGTSGFFNTGQYNTDGLGAYPVDDQGLLVETGSPGDMGKFRTPSLRQVADTEPWNHDGTTATLGAVIDNYARGGRWVQSGNNPGDGAESPIKDDRITGFTLSETERSDLLAFLHALSDPSVLVSDPPQDPFCRGNELDPDDCIWPLEFE